MIHYDIEHGTDLVDTLRAFVAADYSLTDAAARLYVFDLPRLAGAAAAPPAPPDGRAQRSPLRAGTGSTPPSRTTSV